MLLTAVIMRVCARVLPESSSNIILITSDDYQPEMLTPFHISDAYDSGPISVHRHKREAYDPYEAYYFYPSSLNHRPTYYDQQGPETSYINRRDAQESNRVGEKGQKYKYTPLFQYKSTQSRRRKLFVPNLFG